MRMAPNKALADLSCPKAWFSIHIPVHDRIRLLFMDLLF